MVFGFCLQLVPAGRDLASFLCRHSLCFVAASCPGLVRVGKESSIHFK